MSFVVAIVRKEDIGRGQRITADITFSATYTNPGGEPVLASEFGFRVGSELDLISMMGVTGANTFEYTPDSTLLDRGAVKVYANATGTEITNSTDLSAVTIRVQAVGR